MSTRCVSLTQWETIKAAREVLYPNTKNTMTFPSFGRATAVSSISISVAPTLNKLLQRLLKTEFRTNRVIDCLGSPAAVILIPENEEESEELAASLGWLFRHRGIGNYENEESELRQYVNVSSSEDDEKLSLISHSVQSRD